MGIANFVASTTLVAAALEGPADDLLRLAAGVHVRGVHEVDPGVQRRVDHADRFVMVGVAHRPEHHRPERELADRHARTAEDPALHGCVLLVPGITTGRCSLRWSQSTARQDRSRV
jgi:hypothetical protein